MLLRDSNGGDDGKQPESPVASPPAAVPYDPHDNLLPAECEPTRVATLVMRFFQAATGGGGQAIRYVAPEPEFRGFSVTEGPGPTGVGFKRRSELRRYLERRHQLGEQLRLLEMAVGEVEPGFAGRPTAGPDGNAPLAAFDFTFSRREGGGPTELGDGKSALNCRTGRIFVWAMSFVNPPGIQICPKATIEPTKMSAVVCAPGYRDVNRPVEVPLPR